jgi:hypothetical protein
LKILCKVKEARHKTPHTVGFHLYEIYRIGKSIKMGSSIHGRRGNGKWLVMGMEFLLGQ